MDKKIVYFDIDGTLLTSEKKVLPSTKEALKQLKMNDIHVAIATGRGPSLIQDLLKELDINCYVCYNGAIAAYDGEVIYTNSLNPTLLKEFVALSREQHHPLIYGLPTELVASIPENEWIAECLDSIHFSYPRVEQDAYLTNEIVQILLCCPASVEQMYQKQFPALEFVRWHPVSVDVLPKNGSKSAGIQKMIEKLDFKLENVYAFGDGFNDVEMIRDVGYGIAMGNAEQVVKDHANYITYDNDHDGIYFALKELSLI